MYSYQEGEDELKLVPTFVYCSMIVKYGTFLIIIGCKHMYGVFVVGGGFGVDLVFVFGDFLVLLFWLIGAALCTLFISGQQ